MTERLIGKKAGRNGRQDGPARSLQAPASCRPACRRLFWRGCRGSQIIEYAIVITALSAAFTTMFVYGKRGMQAVIRTTVEKEIGPQADGLQAPGFMADEHMQARLSTISGDNSRAQQTPAGIIYDSDTYSASSGVATIFATQN